MLGCSRVYANRTARAAHMTQLAGLLGLLTGGTQRDEIICVLDQHSQPLPARLPRLIEHVQGDVCEQR